MANFVITEMSDIKSALKEALREIEMEKQKSFNSQRTFTINEVAKRLKMAHATVKKLVIAGMIKTTQSGRITETSINEYLNTK